jgi:hypothetical protein
MKEIFFYHLLALFLWSPWLFSFTTTESILKIQNESSCGVSDALSAHRLRPFRVLISSTSPYIPVLLNWMIYYLRVCPDGLSHLYLLCLDDQMEANLKSLGLTCSSTHILPLGKGAHNRLWLIRTRLSYDLLKNDTDIILSDLDALWLKSPFPDLSLYSNSSSVISSRAKFPESIAERIGSTVCMGFIYVSSSPLSALFWKEFVDYVSRIKGSDDQRAINEILVKANWQFAERLSYTKNDKADTGFIQFHGQLFNVTLLPQNKYRRHCDKRYPEPVRNSTIAHCSTFQKSDDIKKAAAAAYGFWKLREDWKDVRKLSNETLADFIQRLSTSRETSTNLGSN